MKEGHVRKKPMKGGHKFSPHFALRTSHLGLDWLAALGRFSIVGRLDYGVELPPGKTSNDPTSNRFECFNAEVRTDEPMNGRVEPRSQARCLPFDRFPLSFLTRTLTPNEGLIRFQDRLVRTPAEALWYNRARGS
jgi:hypothetical protein